MGMRRPEARPGYGLKAALGLMIALALAPSVGLAQTMHRSPQAREALLQLAYDLGEAHALHRLCAGPADATWYGRMQQLEAEEAADEGFRRRLVDSFNSGFAAGSSEFPACSPQSRAAERSVAARGAAVAQQLAADAG
jgi:uncharacterized protein (TIGR02301 family)